MAPEKTGISPQPAASRHEVLYSDVECQKLITESSQDVRLSIGLLCVPIDGGDGEDLDLRLELDHVVLPPSPHLSLLVGV